jgi:hypothetical protein
MPTILSGLPATAGPCDGGEYGIQQFALGRLASRLCMLV